jgi:hypothetical protein
MKLTYRLGPIPSSTVLPQLASCAAGLGFEIEALESASADLYFHQAHEALPASTGIVQCVGTEALSEAVAAILLAWAKERHELMQVAPLRHELGNLIVILMGRLMRLRQDGTDDEHLTSLQNLHQRLTVLYQAFDRIVIPRY